RTEPAGEGSLALSAVGGAGVNLTGQARPAAPREAPTFAPACRLEGAVLQRTLRDGGAAGTPAAVAGGAGLPWLRGGGARVRGGGEAGIIQGWRRQAARESDAINRATLGTLTLLFAVLGQCRPAWENGLRGWNMQTSPFLDQFRAEGRIQGRLEATREAVARLGRKRFSKAPTRKQRAALDGLTDLARLERILDRVLDAASWDDL